jgi:hypothetical protein
MSTMSTVWRGKLYAMILAAILLAGASAFATVWMEQQIARSARRGQEVESQLAETVRRLRQLDERIAALHQPAMLQGRVAGIMRPTHASQLVLVGRGEMTGGVARADAGDPYEVSLDLAFIDLEAGP